MEDADEIVFNLDGISKGRVKKFLRLSPEKRNSLFNQFGIASNVTDWEFSQAITNYKEKTTFYLDGIEKSYDYIVNEYFRINHLLPDSQK